MPKGIYADFDDINRLCVLISGTDTQQILAHPIELIHMLLNSLRYLNNVVENFIKTRLLRFKADSEVN